jgi:hypothetical protein
MAATPITIEAYASYALVVTLKDSAGAAIDLSAVDPADFVAQVRLGASKPKLADFTITILEGGTTGKIKMALTPTQTDSLPSADTLKYDLFWSVDANTRHRLLYGDVTVENNITKV